jgi:carboxypeptidase Q
MLKKILIHFILLSFIITRAGSVLADEQAQDQASSLRDDALGSTQAWDIVESLTTEVGARLAGTKADRRALAWAQSLLNTSGFDRVWLEKVEFPVWQRHSEHARIVEPFPQALQITALGYSGSTQGELKAQVVSFDTLENLKAASPEQLKGKIALIDTPMARTRDGSGYGQISAMRAEGGKIAKSKGAVAVLIRSLGTDLHRFPHTGGSALYDDPIPAAALSAPDADQLQRVLARGKPVTVALSIKTSTAHNGVSWNVIGQIDGREKPDEVVLIGAHLDSWDLGTGAIDDGAGVGITTAAAQLIAKLHKRPRRSVRLVLFASEENGLRGAKAYAKQHGAELAKHIVASESDFGTGRVWSFDTDSSALMDAAMPLLEPLGIKRGKAARGGGPDIIPMKEKGVRVFRLNQDGTDYFDYHHTADDTLDKVDAEALKQNVAAWVVVTYLAAELEW